jgi:ABC-type multidrug transport system permease subunit
VNAALALTVGVARSWVALYTTRLPLEIREARRSEIDSDLWEQQWLAARRGDPAFGTAIEVLTRILLGILADIAWRIEAGATQSERRTTVNQSILTRIAFIAASLGLLALVANGIGMMLGAGEFDNQREQLIWGFSFFFLPAVSLVGLWLCASKPRLGLAMVIAGAVPAALLMYWMIFITLPIAVVIILIAIKRSGINVWPFRPTPTGTA